jgi:crotonobetaine/carnitine-CoA ligase
MLGYFEDEEATRAAFDGGWLHSGDLGSFDASGNLYFHGRRGDMIKRAGENISVQEVESVLVSHPGVADVAVVGIDDPVRDQAVKAFIVRRDGHRPSEDELRDFCRERLAYFKVPEFVAFVPVLPRNASGKISKRELLAPLEQWQGKGAG